MSAARWPPHRGRTLKAVKGTSGGPSFGGGPTFSGVGAGCRGLCPQNRLSQNLPSLKRPSLRAPACALAHLRTGRGAAAGRAWVAAPQPSHGRCGEVHGRSTQHTHAFNTLGAVRGPGGERSGAVSAEKQLVKDWEGPAVAGLPPRRQSFRARYRYLCPPLYVTYACGRQCGNPSFPPHCMHGRAQDGKVVDTEGAFYAQIEGGRDAVTYDPRERDAKPECGQLSWDSPVRAGGCAFSACDAVRPAWMQRVGNASPPSPARRPRGVCTRTASRGTSCLSLRHATLGG